MRLLNPKCPECGELAYCSVEVIMGGALLTIDEDGAADYKEVEP